MSGKSFAKKWLFLTLIVLLSAGSVLAEENITELRIDSITTPIEAGGRLDFSFSAGNMSGPPCSAEIEYWFGQESEEIILGNDNFYLNEGQVVTESISLIIPTDLYGVRDFYLEMKCNDSITLASRIIEIKGMFPTMPQLSEFQIERTGEEEQLQFNYIIESNNPEQVAVHVDEKIMQDNNVVWENSQNIAVAGSAVIKSFGPILPPGNYSLIITANHGLETARMVREFTVSGAVFPIQSVIPGIAIAGLVFLLFSGFAVAIYYTTKSRHKHSMLARVQSGEETPAAKMQSVCLLETEVSGVLDENTLDLLLDDAGLAEENRASAFEVATRVPIIQTVRSCVFTDQDGEMSFETIVANTVVNNSNRDWQNVTVFATIPDFLVKDINDVSSDTEMQAEQEGSLLRLNLEKIGAKQSASIVYKSAKLISRDEAGRVSLPAVLDYKKGKRLKTKKVKVKKIVEEKQLLKKLFEENNKKKN